MMKKWKVETLHTYIHTLLARPHGAFQSQLLDIFDIEMKRERLRRLQGRSKKDVKKRISRRLFHKWKQNLLSQKGKGRGCYRIDRRAEQAVYEVLQEQLKAHTHR